MNKPVRQPLSVELTPEQEALLESITTARDETPEAWLQRTVTDRLKEEGEYRRLVQEGIDAVAAGDVSDWDEFEAELRAKYGDFDG